MSDNVDVLRDLLSANNFSLTIFRILLLDKRFNEMVADELLVPIAWNRGLDMALKHLLDHSCTPTPQLRNILSESNMSVLQVFDNHLKQLCEFYERCHAQVPFMRYSGSRQ